MFNSGQKTPEEAQNLPEQNLIISDKFHLKEPQYNSSKPVDNPPSPQTLDMAPLNPPSPSTAHLPASSADRDLSAGIGYDSAPQLSRSPSPMDLTRSSSPVTAAYEALENIEDLSGSIPTNAASHIPQSSLTVTQLLARKLPSYIAGRVHFDFSPNRPQGLDHLNQ